MQISAMQAAGVTSTTGANSATGAGKNKLTNDDFMVLLVAQLRAQDPMNPMDPTGFVNQLVQFNSLDQLIAIRKDLDPTPTTGQPTNPVGALMPTKP